MIGPLERIWSSQRVRLVVASVAWTLGLLYLTHISTVIIFIGPQPVLDALGRVSLTFVVAIALMTGGFAIVRHSMATLTELRRRLSAVREGRERVVTGRYPAEVQPLVDDLNHLLEHQDRRVREALAKAGDLAHGLKTPLAVLTQEADRLVAVGQHDVGNVLAQQTERMRRHVDYHLAHARAAASGATPGARCSVAESVAGIARTLQRLHAERGVEITVDVPGQYLVRAQREDLDEILGNLLDNACKWAESRVTVSAVNGNNRIVITVDDDGPGIALELRDAVLERGVRADEAAPGSGFGLAIARDLVDLYQGSLVLGASPVGGLRVEVQLPQAVSDHSESIKLH